MTAPHALTLQHRRHSGHAASKLPQTASAYQILAREKLHDLMPNDHEVDDLRTILAELNI
jgi:hypothetical protein